MTLYLRSIFHLRSLFRRPRSPHCPECCNLDGCLTCEANRNACAVCARIGGVR